MSPRKSELRIGLTVRRTFSVSKANWKKLEKAYGRDIPEQARGKIYTATETMLRGADEEHSGRLSEIIKRITEFKRAASILLALFTAPGDQRSIHFAAECIEVGLTELSNTTFDEYHDYTMAFAGACKRAPDIATSMSVEGTRQAWEIWIKDLTVICARY